jgi:hypothetical protein
VFKGGVEEEEEEERRRRRRRGGGASAAVVEEGVECVRAAAEGWRRRALPSTPPVAESTGMLPQ